MLLIHLIRIHAIDVIGTEDQDMLRTFVLDQVEVLQDRIGATGIPTGAQSLLCRNRSYVVSKEG